MKPYGAVRKVDQLGRVVLPKALRRDYVINQGDSIEILVRGHNIILEKHVPKCLFCASAEMVTEFMEKYICRSCLEEMSQIR